MSRPVSESRPTSLGLRIQKLREAASISARALSAHSGATQSIIYQIERGLIESPNGELLNNIARALGTTVDFLVRGVGDEPTPEESRTAFDAFVATDGTGDV